MITANNLTSLLNRILSFEAFILFDFIKCLWSFTRHSCADPESFVRGGPNLITFFGVFF